MEGGNLVGDGVRKGTGVGEQGGRGLGKRTEIGRRYLWDRGGSQESVGVTLAKTPRGRGYGA